MDLFDWYSPFPILLPHGALKWTYYSEYGRKSQNLSGECELTGTFDVLA